MAAASRKKAEVVAPLLRQMSPVRLAHADDLAAPSPALQRQADLHAQWATMDHGSDAPARWSHRRTAVFIAVTCGGFWTCVILGAARLAL